MVAKLFGSAWAQKERSSDRLGTLGVLRRLKEASMPFGNRCQFDGFDRIVEVFALGMEVEVDGESMSCTSARSSACITSGRIQ